MFLTNHPSAAPHACPTDRLTGGSSYHGAAASCGGGLLLLVVRGRHLWWGGQASHRSPGYHTMVQMQTTAFNCMWLDAFDPSIPTHALVLWAGESSMSLLVFSSSCSSLRFIQSAGSFCLSFVLTACLRLLSRILRLRHCAAAASNRRPRGGTLEDRC